ncbi:phosphoribosyltransferase [Clostridium sp.]|jgi:hypoxanthine phosphoribosyltransferase|uniref:phosphoribosyltransferase n=1 Tax=Clostridium sp. TaxID=1506 RepID=UPI002589AB1C|nr:phosphoribosyltransferase [Clostridium sp.]MDF2503055.1 hypothetical protein [Clostridium sp.]
MIFYNKLYDNSLFLYLINYEKKYLDLEMGSKNFDQGEVSSKINGLNSAEDEISDANARMFAEIIDPILHENITICSVPSHNPQNTVTGINRLIHYLCKDNKRVDGTSVLYRNMLIDKISMGGKSTKEIHNKTISTKNCELIKEKEVLLIDDIALTCNSISVCKEKLLSYGAKRVICIVLGYAGNANSQNHNKANLDNIIKNKISDKTSGHMLYNKYLNNKNKYPDIAKVLLEDIYYEIYNADNPYLINSGEVAIKININHKNDIYLLTNTKKLPPNLINSFIGTLLSYQMQILGYTRLDKIDDHFSMYTPLLYSIDM